MDFDRFYMIYLGVWHGESNMAAVSVPAPCTSCGGLSGGASWTSAMIFDDETGAPPASYGTGNERRTVWIRQSYKLLYII